tara:strand:- start:124 stop:1119 length:996 start_codon:yes stop_codon:yes gene_type:complete
MKENIRQSFKNFISFRNDDKFLFTAGPASLIDENLMGLRPCFGRGDKDYINIEESVMKRLKIMSGHDNLVRLQGSASLALEIITANFLYGNILIISTGYYSDRLIDLTNNAKNIFKEIKNINIVSYENMRKITGNYDWIVSCYTETSRGFKISIKDLKNKANELNSKIMLDATASIGLEENHELADVIGYSSCKGLFGLTGAAFIAYHQKPKVEVNSFYLNIKSHILKKMTGPYHAICSLHEILKSHEDIKHSVKINKRIFIDRFREFINIKEDHQPLLCTFANCKIIAKSDKVVLYKPRDLKYGSIVCHLGEAHLGLNAKGKILDYLDKD